MILLNNKGKKVAVISHSWQKRKERKVAVISRSWQRGKQEKVNGHLEKKSEWVKL